MTAFLEHDTDVAGVRIHWAEGGAGDPPFLLVHGLASSGAKFLDAARHLAASRRTIVIDMPGFGRSGAPRASYTPAWLAGGVRAFLDAIGVARAVVVGNSLGGLVAIRLAAAWPGRVEALVAVAPVLPDDEPGRPNRDALKMVAGSLPVIGPLAHERYWARAPAEIVGESLRRNFVDPSRVSPSTMRMLEEDAARKGWDRSLRLANARAQRGAVWAATGRRETTWSVLRSVSVPTLFVWGEHDRVLPLRIGRRAVGEVPGSHLIVLDDCGHNPQVEMAEEFSAAVLSFVRAVEAAPRGALGA